MNTCALEIQFSYTVLKLYSFFRLVHVCVEMNLKFGNVQYVVFDEADQLFELGFAEQLNDILGRLPEVRQMVLFSATLPKMLVEFARAGLREPVLVR